jgi:hypothetical protein
MAIFMACLKTNAIQNLENLKRATENKQTSAKFQAAKQSRATQTGLHANEFS